MEKLKRIVIKEELVALTGNYINAILLQQFIYWSERVKDFDKFIEQEKIRSQKYSDTPCNFDAQNGWIYKSAEQLSNETMLGLSNSNIRKHIKELIKHGWIMQRTNPKYKWDKTLQYRVDLVKVQSDLNAIGYTLEGYKCDVSSFSKIKNGVFKLENQTEQNRTAIPETTSETKKIEKLRQYKIDAVYVNAKDVAADSSFPDYEMINQFYQAYLKALKYYGYRQKRIKKENVEDIFIDIGTIIQSGVDFEEWKDCVIDYIGNLPKGNDGDIQCFLKASPRYFEVRLDEAQ